MAILINQSREALELEDGTVIGAAHTPEARREGVTLTEGDRKRLESRLLIVEDPAAPPLREQMPAGASSKTAPATEADSTTVTDSTAEKRRK